MFKKVLVANRGEIAVRIIRTLEEMGIRSVAVVSEADVGAAHALAADTVEVLGPAPAAASYLNIEAILDAARRSGAEAIHPGYGFLSENPRFAAACGKAGITFIGPPAEAMRVMGSKTESRVAMERAGVPVVPGFHRSGAGDDELARAAKDIGYPVLVKAAAGGGGKGMRTVREPRDLSSALDLCRNEAGAAFGDDTVYVEKLIARPRHVEIQVFGDADGRVFHIGERECSIQRRHQKILEETPSVAVDAALRARMGEAAVRAAEAVGYRNAGTVEFLLDESGAFYFLEMNARLQVEHPVTEMVYGLDLVAAQLRAAAGEPLDVDPDRLTPRGHAVEARVYAEDPEGGFLPQSGPVLRLIEPVRPGVRVDSGLVEGQEVAVHYDPLLAKVTAWGETRDVATRRLRAALADFTILGLRTNIDFLIDVLSLPAWRDGHLSTAFLEENLREWKRPDDVPAEVVALAAEACLGGPAAASGGAPAAIPSPWTTLGSWRALKGGS